MSTTTKASADWVGSTRTKLLAWWLPHAALVAGLLAVVPARTVIWIVALAWMGVSRPESRCAARLRPDSSPAPITARSTTLRAPSAVRRRQETLAIELIAATEISIRVNGRLQDKSAGRILRS